MEAKAGDVKKVRAELHELVDKLPDQELHAAHRFIEYLRDRGDPLLRKLMDAPIDDEPETEEEEALVAEAREELARGETIAFEEIKREFGL